MTIKTRIKADNLHVVAVVRS